MSELDRLASKFVRGTKWQYYWVAPNENIDSTGYFFSKKDALFHFKATMMGIITDNKVLVHYLTLVIDHEN